MNRLLQATTVVFALVLAFACAACNEHAPLSENAQVQNNALTQIQVKRISPAIGTFAGRMRMIRTGKSYDCTLITREKLKARAGETPSERREDVQIAGSVIFPELQSASPAEQDNYLDLKKGMGMWLNMVIDQERSNFNDTTGTLTLPYNVGTAEFGDLTGKLDGDHFVGTWYVNPLGDWGYFDLSKVNE